MRSYMMLLGLLFIAYAHPSFAQKEAESVVRVAEGAPLVVECPLPPQQETQWRLDGAATPADMAAGEAPRGARVAARLRTPAARAHHAGLYTCSADPAAPRVRVLVLPAAAAPSPSPTPAPADDDEPMPIVLFDVNRNFSLDCSPGGDADAGAIAYSWLVNGTELEKVAALKGRYELAEGGAQFRLTARAHEDDFGNYSCLVGGAPARAWRVHARPLVRLLANTNVVEGQTLKITCKVVGKPYPPVAWTYAREEGANASDVAEALRGRAVLGASAAGVPQGELRVEKAEPEDAGLYYCSADPAAAPAVTVVRVKAMYAALWPFLGICAEVFVLCAIILVYEKRRTKPELDDSDTDNHEQKKA